MALIVLMTTLVVFLQCLHLSVSTAWYYDAACGCVMLDAATQVCCDREVVDMNDEMKAKKAAGHLIDCCGGQAADMGSDCAPRECVDGQTMYCTDGYHRIAESCGCHEISDWGTKMLCQNSNSMIYNTVDTDMTHRWAVCPGWYPAVMMGEDLITTSPPTHTCGLDENGKPIAVACPAQ